MTEAELQWLKVHKFLIDWVDCDADWYQSMHVDPKVDKKGLAKDEDVKPDLSSKRIKIPTLCYVKDVSKILKCWPNEDLPNFQGTIDKDAKDWLGTMVLLLTDRQAHPSL